MPLEFIYQANFICNLAAKGCDGLIFQLAEDLVAAGILKVSQAGQTIAGGEILLRRGWGA